VKKKSYVFSFASAAVVLISVTGALGQHEHHGQQRPPAQTGGQVNMQPGSTGTGSLFDEPHEALAMAHLQNVATFAKTLSTHVEANKAVDAAFAQASVAEIRRNFDTLQQHLTFYRRTMPADTASHAGMGAQSGTQSHSSMQSNTLAHSHSEMQSRPGISQVSDDHITEIRRALELLEREVYSDTPRTGKISERAAAIVKHIEMITSHGGHKM
jgi:hypothetical protein